MKATSNATTASIHAAPYRNGPVRQLACLIDALPEQCGDIDTAPMLELLRLVQDAATGPQENALSNTERLGGEWRLRFAREAAAEVAALGKLLQHQCPDELNGDVVRGLAIRLEALGNIVTSCFDDGDTAEQVAPELFGRGGARKMLQQMSVASHG